MGTYTTKRAPMALFSFHRMFNGERTGAPVVRRFSVRGLEKYLERFCGNGWGVDLHMRRSDFERLGGYRTTDRQEYLPPSKPGNPPIQIWSLR